MPKLLLFVFGTLIFTSCTTTRDFNFQTAYKFKYIKYGKSKSFRNSPDLLSSDGKFIIGNEDAGVLHPVMHFEANLAVRNQVPKKDKIISSGRKLHNNSELPTHTVVSDHSKLKLAGLKNVERISRETGFRDLHPALQGFLFVVFGFGLVLVGSLIGNIAVLPTVLIIAGFALAIFGFYKMLSQL